MNFLRARFLEAVDPRLARGPAHDGVVHDDDALALHQFADEVELHAHREVANELRGLEEAAPHVVIADEGHLVRDAGLHRVAQRGGVTAVGHGDDEVGLDLVLARQLPPHLDADAIDVAVGDRAVGPGEVNVFEDTEGAALVRGKGLHALQAVLIDDDNFPGSTSRTNLA